MNQRYDLKRLVRNSEDVLDYLTSAEEGFLSFTQSRKGYKLNGEVVENLKRYVNDAVIIVFSAEWCKDCARNLPVLGLISEATEMTVRVFGHLIRDATNPNERWRTPPSPIEVREFNVVKIPLIVVLNREGEKLGEVVENPQEGKTLEKALLDILENA